MSPLSRRMLVAILLLTTAAYALAEDLTLTTYYPSPRGVYNELRVGSGSVSTPAGKLNVVQEDLSFTAPPAFRVDDQTPPDPTPFVIDRDGNVGVGTAAPLEKLHIKLGGLVLQGTRTINVPAQTAIIDYEQPNDFLRINTNNKDIAFNTAANGTQAEERMRITAAGNVGIGTATPIATLEVAGTTRLRGAPGQPGLMVDAAGNAGVGVGSPISDPSPANGLATGNLQANDVYLSSANRWLSQGGGSTFGGGYSTNEVCAAGGTSDNPFTGAQSCPPGFNTQRYGTSTGPGGNCHVVYWLCWKP